MGIFENRLMRKYYLFRRYTGWQWMKRNTILLYGCYSSAIISSFDWVGNSSELRADAAYSGYSLRIRSIQISRVKTKISNQNLENLQPSQLSFARILLISRGFCSSKYLFVSTEKLHLFVDFNQTQMQMTAVAGSLERSNQMNGLSSSNWHHHQYMNYLRLVQVTNRNHMQF